MPPAFILSQDQTLRYRKSPRSRRTGTWVHKLESVAATRHRNRPEPEGEHTATAETRSTLHCSVLKEPTCREPTGDWRRRVSRKVYTISLTSVKFKPKPNFFHQTTVLPAPTIEVMSPGKANTIAALRPGTR